jgi:peptidoglycan/xylan/chitin deacetylase (PgdA/CDA1 family)
VITIDDGWFGTFKVMVPELVARGLPATIYSTSYYTENQFPVFGVALDYLLSRSTGKIIDLESLGGGLSGQFQLAGSEDREAVAEKLEEHASSLGAREGFQLLERLAEQVNVAFSPLVRDRVFHLMTPAEISQAAQQGIDIQLHTHRHRQPLDAPDLLRQEIQENRDVLNSLTANPLRHFCYPSGVWSPVVFPILRSAGIESAVTTEQGLNFLPGSTLNLRRISDGEYVDELEFEAELSGFADVVRKLRAALGTRSGEKRIEGVAEAFSR